MDFAIDYIIRVGKRTIKAEGDNMTIKSLKTLDVGIASELVMEHHPEDYSEYYFECWYVTVKDADGNSWNHKHGFKETRDNAINKAAAEKLMAKVIARGYIDLNHWTPGRAIYGSKAWEEYGEAEQIAFEREQEEYSR